MKTSRNNITTSASKQVAQVVEVSKPIIVVTTQPVKATAKVKATIVELVAQLAKFYGVLVCSTSTIEAWESCKALSSTYKTKAGQAWTYSMLFAVCAKLLGVACSAHTMRIGAAIAIPNMLVKRDGSYLVQALQVGYDLYTKDGHAIVYSDTCSHGTRKYYATTAGLGSDAQLQALLSNMIQPAMTHAYGDTTHKATLQGFAKVCTVKAVRAELAKLTSMKAVEVYATK